MLVVWGAADVYGGVEFVTAGQRHEGRWGPKAGSHGGDGRDIPAVLVMRVHTQQQQPLDGVGIALPPKCDGSARIGGWCCRPRSRGFLYLFQLLLLLALLQSMVPVPELQDYLGEYRRGSWRV